jgi:hypothetical protein
MKTSTVGLAASVRLSATVVAKKVLENNVIRCNDYLILAFETHDVRQVLLNMVLSCDPDFELYASSCTQRHL